MISIGVNTRNRANSLRRTLACLRQLQGDDPFEIQVVDNASTDNTREVVASLPKDGPPLRYVYEEKLGLSHVLNRHIREARGEVLAFIDDDETVPPEWLRAIEGAFRNEDADLTFSRLYPLDDAGNVVADHGLRFPARDYGPEPIRITAENCERYEFGTGISAYRLATLRQMGFFRTDLGRRGRRLLGGEDTDMFRRYVRAGKGVWYWPQAVVYHHIDAHRTTPGYALRKSFYGGISTARVDRREHTRRLFGVPLFWYRRLLVAALKLPLAVPRGRRAAWDELNHCVWTFARVCEYCRCWLASLGGNTAPVSAATQRPPKA